MGLADEIESAHNMDFTRTPDLAFTQFPLMPNRGVVDAKFLLRFANHLARRIFVNSPELIDPIRHLCAVQEQPTRYRLPRGNGNLFRVLEQPDVDPDPIPVRKSRIPLDALCSMYKVLRRLKE